MRREGGGEFLTARRACSQIFHIDDVRYLFLDGNRETLAGEKLMREWMPRLATAPGIMLLAASVITGGNGDAQAQTAAGAATICVAEASLSGESDAAD
jgi:hypothetical protein